MRIATLLLGAFIVLSAHRVHGQTTITVNTLVDNQSFNGDCSLREAILAAETNAPRDACPAGGAVAPDEIVFSVAGTILYQLPLIFITQDVTITGPGAAVLTLDGNAAGRLFQVNGGTVTFSNLTFSNGNSAFGSLMSISSLATVTLTDCVFSNGTTGEAVRNSGSLTVDNCTFTGTAERS